MLICFAIAILVLALYDIPDPHPPEQISLKDVDLVGAVLFVVSMTPLLVGLSLGDITYAWGDWRIIVPIILGLLGLALFVVNEAHICRTKPSKPPLINVTIFLDQHTIMAYIGGIILGLIVSRAWPLSRAYLIQF